MVFDPLTYIFIAIVLLAAILASLAAWAPRRAWVRVGALIVTLLIVPIAFFQVTEMLSRPKPANYEWLRRNVDKVTVLSASFDEQRAIYLWVRFEGDIQPRYYSLPWSNRLAENLQDTLEEAVQQNGNVVLRHFFSRQSLGDYGDLNMEIVPPPVPPQKPPYTSPPRVFNPREKAI
ncbi:MAG: hypothetical protein HOK54_03435 [Alphaproteobacteria bacterium]|nr:hypothetical protein [Alphaproteobacteria bacterium]